SRTRVVLIFFAVRRVIIGALHQRMTAGYSLHSQSTGRHANAYWPGRIGRVSTSTDNFVIPFSIFASPLAVQMGCRFEPRISTSYKPASDPIGSWTVSANMPRRISTGGRFRLESGRWRLRLTEALRRSSKTISYCGGGGGVGGAGVTVGPVCPA